MSHPELQLRNLMSPDSFKKYFIYLFLEREKRRGEREGKKHQHVRDTSIAHITIGNQACNPGLCPDMESTCDLLL